jgi:Ser-tRNA(Ala) deacylase AlaX
MVQSAVAAAIAVDLPVRRSILDKGIPVVKIGEFPATHCIGTHCNHLSELGSVAIRHIKRRKGRLRFSYELLD